jgi:hypothetical protein
MDQIETALVGAFNDYRLSKNDPNHLYHYLLDFKDDAVALSIIQEKTFALVSEYLQRQPTFDVHAFGWLEHMVKALEQVKCDNEPRNTAP